MAQEPDQIAGDSAPETQPAAAATASPPSPATTEIRTQIEHTRAEITQTIDAIEARLSPSRLMTQAKQTVREATVGRAQRLAARTNGALGNGAASLDAKRVIDTLKANPLPLVIAGIAGIALFTRLVLRSRHRSDRRRKLYG